MLARKILCGKIKKNGYLENSSKRKLLSHITTSYEVQTSNGPVVNKFKHYQYIKSSVLEFSK